MHHDECIGERCDETVTFQEGASINVAGRRIGLLAGESAVGGNRVEERSVVGRIGATQPGGEYGEGRPARVEATAVRGRIDPVCSAGDDHPAGQSELRAEFASEAECVFVRGAGTDDGDRALKIRKRPRQNELSRTLGFRKVEKS